MKKYEVAITKEGKIAKCRMVSEEEYKQLQQQHDRIVGKEKTDSQAILDAIAHLEDKITELEQEIKVLKGED